MGLCCQTSKATIEFDDKPKFQANPRIKAILVGANAVGKTCLIIAYLDNKYSDDYEPTILDVFEGRRKVNQ